jgi:hypothetical protein
MKSMIESNGRMTEVCIVYYPGTGYLFFFLFLLFEIREFGCIWRKSLDNIRDGVRLLDFLILFGFSWISGQHSRQKQASKQAKQNMGHGLIIYGVGNI